MRPTTLPLFPAADIATARTLFNEAHDLVADGKQAEARLQFKGSWHLHRGIGTRFNLADCWDGIVRTASASGLFLEISVGRTW